MNYRFSRIRPWQYAAYLAAAVLLGGMRPLLHWVNAPPLSACADGQITVVDYTVKLLQCDPTEWSSDSFRLSNTNGLRIWTANDVWGLSVERNAATVRWNSTTAYQPTPEQQRIWDAYQAWAKNRVMTRTQ